MKLGLHLDNANTYETNELLANWREMVAIADSGGFDYVSVVDHLVPFPSFRSNALPLLDPWQLLASFAVLTNKVTLLTLVSNGSLIPPVRLAKQIASLAALSGDRVMLGIGAGGYELDEAALGLAKRNQVTRYEYLQESLEVIQRLWAEEFVTFAGRHHQLESVTSSPRPNQTPDILIAGKSRRVLELAAEYGAACNFAFTGEDELQILIDSVDTLLHAQGRARSGFDVTLLDRVFLDATTAEAEARWQAAGSPLVNGHRGLVGSAEELLTQFSRLQNIGVDTLFCMFQTPIDVERFCREVVPNIEQPQA